MKRIKHTAVISAVLALTLMLMMLSGCGEKETAPVAAGPVISSAPETPVESSSLSETAVSSETEADTETVRLDGERFERVILLEGMEEKVGFEHVRNEDAGFELDYEYEVLSRRSEPDREFFISRYDNPDNPWNYLEVAFYAENADSIAEAYYELLSEQFETVVAGPYTLDRAGSCLQISASEARAEKTLSGSLQTIYIIPAADGCRVASIHCTVESAEGFGKRFSNMLNTLMLIDR